MRYRLLLASLYFLLVSTTCFAYPDTLQFYLRHYTDDNGLPQNSVKFVAPDEYGFIWLSTEDGLVRYDGSNFVRFSKDNMEVTSNRFQALYRGIDGRGLYSYNANNEQVQIKQVIAQRDSVSPSWPQRKSLFGSLDLWPPGSLFADGSISMHRNVNANKNQIIIPGNAGNYYIYNGKTVGYYRYGKLSHFIPFHTDDDWRFFLINDRLYLLEAKGSVTSFFLGTNSQEMVGDIIKDPLYKKGRRDMALFWNICIPDQVILYFNRSFYLVKEKKAGTLTTQFLFSGFNAPKQNLSSAYYNAATGNLYLGSNTKGFFVLSPKRFITITHPQGENIFYSQASHKRNQILTMGGAQFEMSGDQTIVESNNQLIRSDYMSLITDSNGKLWTKWRYWLYEYGKGGSHLLNSWMLPAGINVIHEGRRGTIWIGTAKGIFELHPRERSSVPVPFLSFAEKITYLQQTAEDTLFFGTEKGLYRVSLTSWKIDSIQGMEGKDVRSIYAPVPGEVWITSYGDGFFLFKSEKLTQFPLDRNRYLTASHFIVEDHNGFFWIPTNKGLFKMAKADLLEFAKGGMPDLYYHYYDKRSGFNTNEFNGGCEPCAVRLDNGYISLPSMNGLVLFKPDSLPALLPGEGLFIDKIELGGKDIHFKDLLKLPRQFGQLNFYVSTPYMGNRNNVQIEYSLVKKGIIPVWSPVGNDGVISFSMLPPMDYTLLIRKINGFGKGNYIQKRIHLHILSAWYETGWFYLGCLILLVAMTWLFISFRVKYVKKRNKILEEGIAIKTRELQEQTHIQEKIIQAIGHDIKTPLKYYGILSRKLHADLQKENNSELAAPAKILTDSSDQLYYLVDNLLNYLKVQVGDEPGHLEKFDFHEIIENKILIFKQIALEKGTVIKNAVLPGYMLESNPQLLSVILHNLIDNAVKVTHNGSIEIEAQEMEDHFHIRVKDTGPGLNPVLAEWINNHQDASKIKKGVNGTPNGTGIGLLIVKELVALLDLQLEVVSEAGKGTCFSIKG